MKTVLSISSHVVAGRVGQSISSFAFERLGVGVLPLPTVLYPLTPAPGGPRGASIPQEIFDLALEGLASSGALKRLDALHVGYLRTQGQVFSAARAIERARLDSPGALVLLDPILGDEPGGLYVPKETADAIASELAPRADILTPNLFELGYLTRRAVAGEAEAVSAARTLKARLVAVTSAPRMEGAASTLLVAGGNASRLLTPRLERAPHGTGDLLAALFLARLLLGQAPSDALATAISSVYGLIEAANEAGLDYLPHIERQDLLVSPLVCAAIEVIS